MTRDTTLPPRASGPDKALRRWMGTALRTTAAATAAATLPAAGQAAPAAAVPPSMTGTEDPRGYHETEHIRDYYRLARY